MLSEEHVQEGFRDVLTKSWYVNFSESFIRKPSKSQRSYFLLYRKTLQRFKGSLSVSVRLHLSDCLTLQRSHVNP